MQRRYAAFLVLALACGPAHAQPDYYLKEIVHADRYSWGSLDESTFLHSNELWISSERVTSNEKERTIILDLTIDSMYILNPQTRTYVATSVPPALPEILSDELQWMFKQGATSARVKPTEREKVICGHPCTRYEVTTWHEAGGSKTDEHEMVVWACNTLPVDCAAYSEMVRSMRMIFNRDNSGMAELAKIKGVQMSLEIAEGGWFSGRKLVSEIVELTPRAAPEGIYSVPKDYRRVERLTRADLGL